MKSLLTTSTIIILLAFFATIPSYSQTSFVNSQKVYAKIGSALGPTEDSIKKQFEEEKLAWPPQSIYIRSFKYDRILEVWVRGNSNEPYTLFKSYKVCMQSGTTGPKRVQGDNQIPEGFYYINEFNPNSRYHLALGLNYPNASDRILSDSLRPGGSIYIHGSCVSIGCIAIQDLPIEEVYTLASIAKSNGQDFIPVHVFPVKYDIPKSIDYLTESAKGDQIIHQFILSLKSVFDYFEQKKQIPLILVNKKGDYVIN